jgi:Mlc titration factor MtfA (ptsG expression regulator)
MFGWLRKRRAAPPIPAPLWQATLERYPFLAQREASERAILREFAAEFLARKQFHGADGFVITDAVAVAIAAQAVLPVLHLGLHWYDDFVTIVVHPGEVVARRTIQDDTGVVHHYDEVLAGEAMEGGPVMLSWEDVAAAGDSAHEGYNVVIHEFTHKIDMRDGAPDGCPPLPSKHARQAWLAVLEAEFEAFRERTIIAERFGGEPTWLDPYGASAIDEFFAVASEAYFVNPQRFQQEFPPLALLFDGFFRPRAAAP